MDAYVVPGDSGSGFLDESGRARMVDVSDKSPTARTALSTRSEIRIVAWREIQFPLASIQLDGLAQRDGRRR